MYRVFTLLFTTIIIFSAYAVENQKTWLSFNEFVQEARNTKATQKTLLKFLTNPDPEEIEFGIRFSIENCSYFNAKPVYEAIWNNNTKAFPSLNITYLRQPVILLSISGALSKLNEGKNHEQYQYVKEQLKLRNKKTLFFAILALGKVGTIKDIQTLTNFAKFNNSEFLIPSASSIIEIDRVAGIRALKELKKEFGENSKNAKLISSVISRK